MFMVRWVVITAVSLPRPAPTRGTWGPIEECFGTEENFLNMGGLGDR